MLVYQNNLKHIKAADIYQVLDFLEERYQWKKTLDPKFKLPYKVTKSFYNIPIDIERQSGVTLEILSHLPSPNLQELEQLNTAILKEFQEAISNFGLMIWPLGVPPEFNGILDFPNSIAIDISKNPDYLFQSIESVKRYTYMMSHQVNIDVPLEKIIALINALYKKLGQHNQKVRQLTLLFGGAALSFW